MDQYDEQAVRDAAEAIRMNVEVLRMIKDEDSVFKYAISQRARVLRLEALQVCPECHSKPHGSCCLVRAEVEGK